MSPLRRDGQGFHGRPPPGQRPAVNDMIGRKLRLHYEELQQQPLPDRLADLLDQLDGLPEEPPAPRRN